MISNGVVRRVQRVSLCNYTEIRKLLELYEKRSDGKCKAPSLPVMRKSHRVVILDSDLKIIFAAKCLSATAFDETNGEQVTSFGPDEM